MMCVNHPRIKILYDIYHAHIMDRNIIQTIKNNIGLIGHFPTSGVLGRHELDDTQELNWRLLFKREPVITQYEGQNLICLRKICSEMRYALGTQASRLRVFLLVISNHKKLSAKESLANFMACYHTPHAGVLPAYPGNCAKNGARVS